MALGRSASVLLVAMALWSAKCVQTIKYTDEYINPPIDLTITQIAAQTYRLSYYSDNREGGFAGYGIFTGTTYDAVSAYPANDLTAAQAFCSFTGQFNYKTPVTIEVGPSAASGSICNETTLILVSGSYLALRGRVERADKPWSAGAVVQVP